MSHDHSLAPRALPPARLALTPLVVLTLLAGGCPPAMPGGNRAPVARDVDTTVQEGFAASITLDAGDDDPGDTLSYTVTSLPTHGTLTDSDGAGIEEVPYELPGGSAVVRYQPVSGYTGDDAFSFQASDGTSDSNEADVNLTVAPLTPTMTISADEMMETLTVGAADVVLVENNAEITVTGEARIEGLVFSRQGLVTLRAMGDLTVTGTMRAVDSSIDELDDDTPFDQQPIGIVLIVGEGDVNIDESAVLESNGSIVITDDEDVLTMTPGELFDEVEDVAGDDLDTLVPLPPDNSAFQAPKAVLDGGNSVTQQAMLPPVNIRGTWPPPGAAPIPGDKPVIIARFNGPRDVNLNGWTVNGPPAPAGRDSDNSDDAGMSASGRNGRNGMRLNIRNNGGSINIRGIVTLNLTDGGAGGNATAVCASATGGDGGKAGNFRMTASGGIDLSTGMLVINPGSGGAGGNATVNAGPAGAVGCPGGMGDGASANGGNGSDNRKRLLVRGNVNTPTNIAIGPLSGGAGGNADATACDGGNGLPCCDGGAGGAATAQGGAGGDASVNVTGLAITTGLVTGGAGGNATANGGNGGDGGDCKFGDGGEGGIGAPVTATGGEGGNASNSGTGGAMAGNGGNATANGGSGGDGGDSGLGNPGGGGPGGGASATPGVAGTGATAGTAGTPTQNDGMIGADGGDIPVTLFCFSFTFLPTTPGPIQPGPTEGPVFADDNETMLGTLPIEFVPMDGAQYQRGQDPDHIGIQNGVLLVEAQGLALNAGEPGLIGGLRIEPLYAEGVSESNPVLVEALDADGQVLDIVALVSIPNNLATTGSPETVDALFDLDFSVSTFRVVVPPGVFLTITRFYLIDP
ncbi:MAG: hypothetical protein J5J06_03850 [Phycisphaerae bacterium]|nr:hypothetical protein [Phycisphaerae bacterium]